MDTLVSYRQAYHHHFPDLRLLIVPYRDRFVVLLVAPSNLYPPPNIKAAADWFH